MIKSLLLGTIRAASLFHLKRKGCQLGRNVVVNGLPYVRRKGSGRLEVCDGVNINASRWGNWLGTPGAMILSVEDGALLKLGARAGVSSSQLVANIGIEIGEETMIGAGCLLCDSDMHEVPLGSCNPTAMAPIKIGRRVFIGARSIILKGVTIGDGAVIGAGSVVSSDIPSGVLAAGNPARVIRQLEPTEASHTGPSAS